MFLKIKLLSTTAVLATLGLLASGGLPALAQRGIAPAVPRFTGSPELRQKEFNAFVVQNVNRRVYLNLGFASEESVPIGYKDGNADPFFEAGRYSYFLTCQEPMTAPWTTRCPGLGWNAQRRTLAGYFRITEPRAKPLRANRSFTLTPAAAAR